MNNFRQFCINITNPNIPDLSTTECVCPPTLIEAVDTISADIARKARFLHKVSVPYIEARFENLDKVESLLEFMELDDIPDTLLNHVAMCTFGEIFNKLSNEDRSIIAVLTIYILIHNYIKGGFE